MELASMLAEVSPSATIRGRCVPSSGRSCGRTTTRSTTTAARTSTASRRRSWAAAPRTRSSSCGPTASSTGCSSSSASALTRFLFGRQLRKLAARSELSAVGSFAAQVIPRYDARTHANVLAAVDELLEVGALEPGSAAAPVLGVRGLLPLTDRLRRGGERGPAAAGVPHAWGRRRRRVSSQTRGSAIPSRRSRRTARRAPTRRRRGRSGARRAGRSGSTSARRDPATAAARAPARVHRT